MHSLTKCAAAAAVSLVLSACGGGTSSVPPAPAGANSAARARASSATATGPSLNAVIDGKRVHALMPRNAASSRSRGGNLVYHGGPIQKNPKIFLIFWGFTGPAADPDGVAPYLTSFVKGLSGTPYYDIMTQYYSTAAGTILDPPNEYAGSWYDASSVPKQPSDAEVSAEAVRAVATLGYNGDASYVVQLPHGAYNHLSYCAYHSVKTSSYGPVHYTNLPYQPDFPGCGTNSVNSGAQGLLDSTSETAAHEIAETQTDPDTRTGWYDNSGNEIGDYCAYINLQNITLSTGTFATQPLWSNAANYCAMRYP